MGLLNKFLVGQMEKYMEKNGDRLLTAMQKVNEGGDIEDIDTIVTDYFYLLKAVHRKGKPQNVIIDRNHYSVVIADGSSYDFNMLIPHKDQRNTERKMEIDALFSDNIPREEVQIRLNQKIQEDW